jgi:purine nucleosidase
MSTAPLMMDVDTGVDDAAAIALALGMEADIVGISTVAGNVPIDAATGNTLRVLSLLGADDVPVFRGASRPLVATYVDATHVHGDNGLGGAELPDFRAGEQGLTAPEAIVAMAEEFDGELVFVSVGPMTNLAMALSLRPRIAQQIARVVIMGGAFWIPGNVTPHAEFNAYVDPHALDQVFAADWNEMYAIGLDVTHKTVLTQGMWAEIPETAEGAAGLIRAILARTFQERARSGFFLHDALALVVALDPSIVATTDHAISVFTDGDERGRTIAGDGGQVNVAHAVDVERFVRIFCDATGVPFGLDDAALGNAE